jgi:hypothetical protein
MVTREREANMYRQSDYRWQNLPILLSVALLFILVVTARPMSAQCSNPANAIVAENCLPGNPQTEWDISYTSDSGDPSIQGFATDISVNAGQTVNFKVNTDATSYSLTIYRLGYYGGMGARKIVVLHPNVQLPQVQPTCITDNSTFLLDCGNWSVSASWQVPANATSGLYFAHLIRQDTGGDSHIFFVVRNDAGHSAILYQTSDMTWQAYNNYGGHSLYGTSDFDPVNRGYKVSYNRPSNTRAFEAATFLFNAEYPMIRWLEANGYDVSYFTGVDAVRNASLLLAHKVYMSSGHDEYWDGTQRANIEGARDAGVNLAFFSGNEVFWKTRWENSIDGTNTPYRTMVTYKETYGDVVDPLDPPVWTGTWGDPTKSPPADGGKPENALTGTLFKVNGSGPDNMDLSMQVPAADGKMRFWRNTSIATMGANQVATLPPGTLGYEWDVDPDNLVRPAGLFHLSTATYNLTVDYLLNFGTVYGAGTATHHMTTYRAPSGALVFSSGSVQWSWGLDSNHDGDISPDPDPNMQQATVNLFADMGVQPGSLQSGLVFATQSTDSLPPVSTITSPAPGVSVNAGTVVNVSGTATDSGGGVIGGIEVSVDGGQTWHAATGRESWTYSWSPTVVGTATLMSRAVDDSGNLENPQTSGGNPNGGVQVTVNPQVCPCSIWSSTDAPTLADTGDPNSVEVGVKFRTDNDGLITGLRFYKSVNNTGTHIGHLWTSNGTLLATVTFTGESGSGWQQVQLANPVSVNANTTYIASYLAPSGYYSADSSYFLGKGKDNPPVHALADGVDGHNGVYLYTAAPGGFPTNSFGQANYWVDIVFVSGSTFNIAGQITGIGSAGANVSLTGVATANTTTDSNGNYNFGGLLNGTYTVVPSYPGVTFTPASQTVTLNGLSQNNVNFTAVATNPLSISGTIAGVGSGTTVQLTGAASLLAVTDSSGNYSFNGLIPGSYQVTPIEYGYNFTPDTQTVSLSTTSMSGVNFAAQLCPCTSIWPPTAVPSHIDSGDPNSVELGVKFRADVPGTIKSLRFYKANTNTGTHLAHIWSSTGNLLGTATFSNESASGWQEATFASPVPIGANTTYIASYFAPAGHYSFDSNYFQSAGVDNPPLHALAEGVDGSNGVYAYGSTTSFPSVSYNSTNYWVDVVFVVSPPHSLSGTIAGSGGPGATVTLTGGVNLTTTADAAGNFSFASVFDGTYVITASQSGFAFTVASQTVTLNGADVTGVTFMTLTTCVPCQSIWQGTSSPVVNDSGDPQSINVGVKFRADSDGYIQGLRFYKSALNTGVHTGTLWSVSGVPLGTVTFSNESQFGWQQQLFTTPIQVFANTTYIVSYLAPSGHYSGDNNYFTSTGTDSPPLHALANGVDGSNGVYAYGSIRLFPDQTFLSSNYWVDVLFTSTGTAHTLSGAISGNGGPNATVTLSGSSNAVTTADANGNYTFANVPDGSYQVTPTQTSFAFDPPYQTAAVAGVDVAGVNFNTIPGCPCSTIWQLSSAPVAADGTNTAPVNIGVKFRADADGYIAGLRFYKSALNTGSHIATLWSNAGTALSSATFANESQSGWQQVLFAAPVPVSANTTYVASYFAPVGHNAADLNFFTPNGVDSPPLHALADGVDGPNGVYQFAGTSVFPNQSSQAPNYWVDVIYTGTQTYSIAGTISGSGGVAATVNLSGDATATTTADANGNYTFSGLANGNYTVTPSQFGFTFSPAAQSVSVNSAHVLGVNFTSVGQGYDITGTISGAGGPGATVNLTGAVSATTTADANGGYSFTGLINGSYTVTPTKTGYAFTPAGQAVAISGASATANFTSAAQTYNLSGNISGPGGAGAIVNLSGAATATTAADGSGNYTFSGLANGSYTVTPSNAGFAFSPSSQTATISSTDVSGFNFTSLPTVASITLNPLSVLGGSTATGTVTLTAPAPAGGAVVTLSSSNAGAAQVPASVTVAANATSATFIVTTNPVVSDTAVSISATYNTVQSANLTVTAAVLSSITLNPASVLGGGTATGTVTLNGPAPAGGASVALSSSNTGVAQVPATITIASNATTATFTVSTSPVASTTSLSLSATYNATQTAGFTVMAAQLNSVSVSPSSVIGGSTSTGTVALNGPAPAGGAIVALSSSNSSAAQVPASVTVAANATTATFTVTTSPVSSNTPLTLSATYGATQTAAFTVNRPIVSSTTLNPASVPGGATSTGTVTLNGPAPAGGAVVTLSSSNTSAAQVPASVTVPANATTAVFTITTGVVASNTTVTISANYGATQTASLTVTLGLSAVTLSPTSVLGSSSSTGTVTLGSAAPVGGAVVALSSSNTGVAQVPSSVTVAAGATTATFSVTTTPVSSSTSVTITGKYGVNKTANMTVTPPTLTGQGSGLTVSPNTVVGGTSSTGTVKLTGPAPAGGSVVTLSSSNTSVAQVPASVTVPAGTTTATFPITTSSLTSNSTISITAVYGVTRTTTLTVSATVLNSVSLNPNAVTGGNTSIATVTLNGPAPATGAVVTLSSNNTAAAQVPSSITVLANATTATFTVTTSPVSTTVSATISATYITNRTAGLTVFANVVNAVSMSPTSVVGGTSSTGTVTLSRAAPAAGAVVTLSSNNTPAAQVPVSVTVPANATTATFTATTNPVASNASVSISATYNNTASGNLTVTTPAMNTLTLSPSSVVGSTSSTGTITLNGPAPAAGALVTLSSSNTAAAQVPASVTVPANATTATFTITTSAVASNASVTITATRGVGKTAVLAVTAPTLSSLTLSPTTVKGGSQNSTATVTLNGPAPSVGATVTLSSSNTTAATVPSTVTVAAGNTTATFTVTTHVVSSTATVTISGTKGVTRTAAITVTP